MALDRAELERLTREALDRLREHPVVSDAAAERRLADLRARVADLPNLDADARVRLHDDLLALYEVLSPGGALVTGAKLGLVASVLPVLGMITGPIVGGTYGVYRSQRLVRVREETRELLRALVRAPAAT